jgi:hypothetical protein
VVFGLQHGSFACHRLLLAQYTQTCQPIIKVLLNMPIYISPPPQNPLVKVVTAIVAVIMLVGAFMIGMVALLVVAGLGLIAGIAIWIRVAWIKRQLRKSGVDLGGNMNSQPVSGHVIEAEYTVVSDQQDPNDK